MSSSPKRPSPAMAVAFTALLVALSGTAVALPGKNTVDSGDIKNNSVRAADLRSRSLDGTDIKINRVGGNAIKEEVLELEKIGTVPSAETANTANSANTANTANTANSANTASTAANSNNLGGQPPSAYASSAGALKAAFLYDTGIENAFGGPFTVDSDANGVDTITFPFDVNNGTFNVIVGGGGAGQTGGGTPCIVRADPVDANTLAFELDTNAGTECNEEFSVSVF